MNLEYLSIEIKFCIGDNFDGAANLSGQYNGVQAKVKEVASMYVHVWCYAHTLDLVLGETTSSNTPAMSLFALLNSVASFFRDSH